MDLRVLALLGTLVLGGFMLAPDVQAYLDQRKRIADMEESIRIAQDELTLAIAERDRWRDPSYVRSQARDRLYYVLPGEISYLVMNADGFQPPEGSITLGDLLEKQRDSDAMSETLLAAKSNWVDSLFESILRSALDKSVETD